MYAAGELENGGALQVYDGVQHWGTICSGGWSLDDADVACRNLGFTKAMAITTYPAITEDSNYFLDHVGCSKYNPVSNLGDCAYYGTDECPCLSGTIAGAVCATGKTLPPHLF